LSTSSLSLVYPLAAQTIVTRCAFRFSGLLLRLETDLCLFLLSSRLLLHCRLKKKKRGGGCLSSDMNADSALLLQTVLGEQGCVDVTLQQTAETVPFVYRVVAEQSFYVMYCISVVKALLHEKDATFAHLARWQALRATTATAGAAAGVAGVPPSLGTMTVAAAPAGLPPTAPSDSLDLSATIIGGGTCCELLLRLLCDGPHRCLVHPSHLSVVTRQPERLARYAQRGVHCMKRHHGRAAVAQSDVVLLTCPPALFREVVRDLTAAPATVAEANSATLNQRPFNHVRESTTSVPTGSAVAPSSSLPLTLQPNAVLVSCMAGVQARKVAVAFRRTPELTLVTRICPHDGVVDGGALVASSSTSEGGKGSGGGAAAEATGSSVPTPLSLQRVASSYYVAVEQYKAARVAEMRCNISFLRPAVLEQQSLVRAASANAATNASIVRVAGGGAALSDTRRGVGEDQRTTRAAADFTTAQTTLVAPRLTEYTAGRQPAAAPSLDAFLDLWRLMQAYVRTTFAAALAKTRSRGHHFKAGSGNSGSGLISVVAPDSAHGVSRTPGEVEAELLPALTLLPAARTMALWESWWRGAVCGPHGSAGNGSGGGGGRRSPAAVATSSVQPRFGRGESQPHRSGTAAPLSMKVTTVTGGWLRAVYASDAALVADLELQYQRVLERQLPRTH
jgi:hypothetical protein